MKRQPRNIGRKSKENKEKIIGAVRKDIHIEIVTDSSMKRNECLIDTDTGIKYELKKDATTNGIYSDLKEIYKDKLKTYEKKLTN